MIGNKLGVIAIIIALIAVAFGGYALYNGGPVGEDGTEGTLGAPGLPGIDGIDGTDGADGADGVNGATGPQGYPGEQGSTGIDGADGIDLEENLAPIVVEKSIIGCIDIEADWIYSIELDDPEDDLMKVEFYFYIDTAWFGDMGCPLELIPYLSGDHIWLPFYNEVGNDGIYSFDATNLKGLIDDILCGGIPDCTQLTWRYDVMDGENFISEEITFIARECCDCSEPTEPAPL